MAGDWIKMRGNLWDDPRVARLVDLTDSHESQVIGGLYWLWSTADQHTEDGVMPGLTLRQIDRKTGIKGFGDALCAVGWIMDDPNGVVILNFEEHNGTSAKRRCTEAQRKASARNVSASNADNVQTEPVQIAESLPNDCGDEADTIRRSAELEKEKSKSKEKNPPKSPRKQGEEFDPVAVPLPPWLDPELWASWCLDRKNRRKPLTEAAVKQQMADLEDWHRRGLDAERSIKDSISSGYQGLFEPKGGRMNGSHGAVSISSRAAQSERQAVVAFGGGK